MEKKQVKVGVKEGQGPPPGYSWNVWILDIAYEEAMDFLRPEQYQHLKMQFKDLAGHDSPTHSRSLSVRHMSKEDFHELRDKGGPLGKLNVRVFYGVDTGSRSVVVLGTIKKENDGPTPRGTVVTIRRRWRKYLAGDYGRPDEG